MTAVCRGGHHVTTPGATSCACGDITRVPAVRDRYWQCHGDCTVDCGACKGHGRPVEMSDWERERRDSVPFMPPAETQQYDEQRGLYERYRVERISDPVGKHADCRYFVLDPQHDRHAIVALRAYAASVWTDHPQLADDLVAWVGPARPSADTEALRDVLLKHHPLAHTMTGALKGCRCGQVKLGQDVIAHVVAQLLAALDCTR